MVHQKGGPIANFFCTTIVFTLVIRRVLAVDIISSSKLETCVRNGTQGDNTDLSCRQKLVVVVSVDSGDSIASQDVEFTLSCIGSPTGACPCPCNYLEDASCTCRDLVSSLTVSLSKGQLWASYPLTYTQSFNYKPEEAIVRPPNGECKDGEYDEHPTCAWYYLGGQKMVDSQGFVCYCTPGEVWDSTFGQNTKKSRAGLDCDFFSGFIDNIIGRRACSGHCLMMHSHWYGGYAVGEASLQFEIQAQLTFSGNSSSEKLKLSPSTPVAVSTGRTLAAKLLGDLAGYTQLPVLSEKLLMIPNPRTDQSIDSVFANRTEWMLLDRSKISFDGAECDKVGTSFTAFRHQANGCMRAEGTCLSNQLHHILESDKARIAAGQPPLYLVSQYARGLDSNLRQFAGGPLSYALPVAGIRSSLVQLETEADSLKFVVNTSPGAILAARVCTFAEVKCGGFEASAARGYLHVWIANTGTLAAAYTMTVSNCSVNIRPVEAQRFALAAGRNGSITPFEIFVEDDKAVKERYCWVTMLDSRGGVCDTKQVVFFTNATTYEDWPTGGLIGNGTGAGNQTAKDCSKVCSNRLDLICATRNRCWGNVGGFFGFLAGTVLGAGLLFAAFKFGAFGMLTQMFGPLLSCCGGGSKKKGSRSKYHLTDNPIYGDSADGQQHRKRHEKGKASTQTDRQQRTTFDELFEQEQEWQQQQQHRGKSYSKAGRHSSSIAYAVNDPDSSQADKLTTSYSTSGGKRRSSSGAGSRATRWITAAPWDESAAGASGHIPDGRIKGSSIVQAAGSKHKAGSSRSSGADRQNEHGQSDEWQVLEAQRRLYDEEETATWDDPSARHQSVPRYASAPGGPMLMSRDRPASRQLATRSQLADLMSSTQCAPKHLDTYDCESGSDRSPERLHRGSRASVNQSAAEGPENPGLGYRQYSGGTAQQRLQQQYSLRQPDKVMSVPGGSPQRSRGSSAPYSNMHEVGAAAQTVGANRYISSMDRGRAHSRSFSAHELTDDEYGSRLQSLAAQPVSSAMLIKSSRDSVGTADMAAAAAVAARREEKRRSSSQPSRSSRTVQQLSDESDSRYHGSTYMSDAELQQQQLQQQCKSKMRSRGSSKAGSSRGTAQQRSGSIAQQQQQQQQLYSRGSAACMPVPPRSSNSRSPELGQQRQRGQQVAAAPMQRGVGRDKHYQDSEFFASYDDESLADGDNSSEVSDGPEEGQQTQKQLQQPRQSSAHVQQQHSQRRPSAATSSTSAATRRASSTPVRPQQSPAQRLGPSPVGGPLSTAARPLHAPFKTSSSGGASAFKSSEGFGAASTPACAVAERHSASSSPSRARPSSRQSAAASGSPDLMAMAAAARRVMSSEPGAGIGRHRPSQQPQHRHHQQVDAAAALHLQQQSVVNQTGRVPGFVRQAAAALSGSGAGNSPGHGSIGALARDSERRQRATRQDIRPQNPPYGDDA